MTGPRVSRVDRVNPLFLPAEGDVRRIAPRPPELRDEGFEEAFDDRTVAYDAFVRDGRTLLVGPALLNLSLDEPKAAEVVQFGFPGKGIDKTARIALPGSDHVRVTVSGVDVSGPVGEADPDTFADRRVIVTMSKDNDLRWIRDWATYNVRTHGADGVLLYDNGSSYGPEAVREELSTVEGLAVVVVVDWPFKFGPQGGPTQLWDSNFCQPTALEHARQKYLFGARGFLNSDVDELVLSDRSVFELAEELGAVTYRGSWISSHREPSEGLVFAQHRYREPDSTPCPQKWCIDPRQLPERAFLGVHRLWRVERRKDLPDVSYRHFRGVNTSWKYDRFAGQVEPRPEDLDVELAEALAAAVS